MPARGGAEVHAECIRDGLRAAGDEVHVLTSSVGSAAEGTADVVAYGATVATLCAGALAAQEHTFRARARAHQAA